MTLVLGGNNNMESILNSVKAFVGISDEETHFDPELIVHINSVFSTLRQMGVGPEKTFNVNDENDIWNDFIDDDDFNEVKTYVQLRVKMIFDPPSSSSVIDAFERQIKELEWRLTVSASNKAMEGIDDDEL